ncbi:Eukaryotic translation initiation factor 5A [Physocladia obscura]|uniref:Eukaryotic translation initiation factor 5A n=1 Tax=Physocladia obscura TaxID=109957 RepID=A0AAD5SZZ0_9FUNG|nr:Eukaryotic translation initiation factor 5A [Physocladia obscura]
MSRQCIIIIGWIVGFGEIGVSTPGNGGDKEQVLQTMFWSAVETEDDILQLSMFHRMADQEDEHETFEAVGAGASLTYPMQCSALRKNGHVVIKGRPCKIVDIFTGKKLEDVSPSTHNMEVPHVSRTEYELLDIDDDFLSLMTETGATKDDVKMPDGDLGRDLLAAFKAERNLSVTVIKSMGEEAVIAFKDAPK